MIKDAEAVAAFVALAAELVPHCGPGEAALVLAAYQQGAACPPWAAVFGLVALLLRAGDEGALEAFMRLLRHPAAAEPEALAALEQSLAQVAAVPGVPEALVAAAEAEVAEAREFLLPFPPPAAALRPFVWTLQAELRRARAPWEPAVL